MTLPGETGLFSGQLWIDQTGVWGGDLIVATTAGDVWRVTPNGSATEFALLGGDSNSNWEGLTAVPDNATLYGPLAGKILVGEEDSGCSLRNRRLGPSYTVPTELRRHGIPYERHLHSQRQLLPVLELRRRHAPRCSTASAFTGMTGDFLISQEIVTPGTRGFTACTRIEPGSSRSPSPWRPPRPCRDSGRTPTSPRWVSFLSGQSILSPSDCRTGPSTSKTVASRSSPPPRPTPTATTVHKRVRGDVHRRRSRANRLDPVCPAHGHLCRHRQQRPGCHGHRLRQRGEHAATDRLPASLLVQLFGRHQCHGRRTLHLYRRRP